MGAAQMDEAEPTRDDSPMEAGCHSMSHEPAPSGTLTATAMTADCCAVAATTQAPAPAVQPGTTGSVAMTTADLGSGAPPAASRPMPERGREAPPPGAPPPLYTLHSSLLI